MSKVCLINQPVGIGDIVFCQKIGWYYYNKGYKVLWPINNVYLNDVKKYIYSPFIFELNNNNFPLHNTLITKDFIYLKLDGCKVLNKTIMESKYAVANVEYNKDWDQYFNWFRDIKKENELFDLLGLSDDKEYALVNYNYASPPHTVRMNGETKNKNLKIIEMSFINGYSVFDWYKVIENANEICITDSVVALLVEKIKPKTKDLTIITRQSNVDEVKCMYNLDWDYVKGNRI